MAGTDCRYSAAAARRAIDGWINNHMRWKNLTSSPPSRRVNLVLDLAGPRATPAPLTPYPLLLIHPGELDCRPRRWRRVGLAEQLEALGPRRDDRTSFAVWVWDVSAGVAAWVVGSLPSGTVTFLFTDIVGSTRRWEQDGGRMAGLLARHDRLLTSAVEAARGRVAKHTGDGLLAVFGSAADAVWAAVNGQLALAREDWGDEPLLVRMGLHSGEAVETGGDYFGPTLNRAARVMSAGWGGQILCTSATVELARDRVGEGIGFRNLGVHLLRDLSQPLVVWQVTHPHLAERFPPLRSLDRALGNVPTVLSSFVGRRREINQLGAQLADARLLTLTGPGGVGKTRLAIEVAAEAQHDEPDGVWWCELAPIGDARAVPGAVAAVLGVVQEPDRPLTETLTAHLRAKRAVLVLDNCEHLLDAAADLADELARHCPHLRILATSREPLGVDGEVTAPVHPLGEAEALELFVERGRAVRATFVADDVSREICQHLDGIPLALEMAAARLRSMQTKEIAARLEERFRLLVGGRRAPSRQQTLRATVAWSHDLLEDRERRVFRRLAVFVGSFGLDAAEAVTADDELDVLDVDDLLGSLVAKSLIVAEPAADGTTRYRLLETIRQYAAEHLDVACETDERRRLHAEHYTRFVAAAAKGLRGVDEPEWADRVAAELDNLRAAFGWAVAAGDASLALALFAPLPPPVLPEPVAYELLTWIDPALALPGAKEDPNLWPALNWLYQRCMYLLEWDQAAGHREWVRALPGAGDHPPTYVLDGTYFLAVIGDPAAAGAAHERAAELFAAEGDDFSAVRNRSIALVILGALGVDERHWVAVEAHAQRARGVGSPYMAACGIGMVVAVQPNFVLADAARARRLMDEAIPLAARSRNQQLAKFLSNGHILSLALSGDPDALVTALNTVEVSRYRTGVASQAGTLSVVFSVLGHHAEAAELVGALSLANNTYEVYRQSPEVVRLWNATRTALGDEAFDADFARGAARDYDDLVAWLRGVLDRLVARS